MYNEQHDGNFLLQSILITIISYVVIEQKAAYISFHLNYSLYFDLDVSLILAVLASSYLLATYVCSYVGF